MSVEDVKMASDVDSLDISQLKAMALALPLGVSILSPAICCPGLYADRFDAQR
jgi:hypothetical protein